MSYALPIPKEYNTAPTSLRTKGALINPADPPTDGDWMGYLVNVLNSDSMRARRRIWDLAHAIHAVYQKKIVGTDWDDVVEPDDNGGTVVKKSTARKALENVLGLNPFLALNDSDLMW